MKFSLPKMNLFRTKFVSSGHIRERYERNIASCENAIMDDVITFALLNMIFSCFALNELSSGRGAFTGNFFRPCRQVKLQIFNAEMPSTGWENHEFVTTVTTMSAALSFSVFSFAALLIRLYCQYSTIITPKLPFREKLMGRMQEKDLTKVRCAIIWRSTQYRCVTSCAD